VTIASAEGGMFISLKNKAAMNATFDVYLKAYSGDNIDVRRIGRDGNSIKSPRLSLILTCQTDVAKSMINNKTFRDKGLPPRFLLAMCRSLLGKREVGTPDIPAYVKEDYSLLIRRLLEYALERDAPDREIPLSEDGRAGYFDYDRTIEPKLGDLGDLAHMKDWGSKVVGQMLRISGIIALCEERMEINADVIARASALADWYLANAIALIAKPSRRGNESASDERYLLSVIRKSGEGVTVRDLNRKTHHKKNFDLEQTLAELEKDGYIKVAEKNQSRVVLLLSETP